jgi:hypothetical protein
MGIHTKGHSPVRRISHAKEGLCGHLARLRLLASGDPVERIERFFGSPGDDVRESIWSFQYAVRNFLSCQLDLLL